MSPFITTKHAYIDSSRRNTPRESVHALIAMNAVTLAFAVAMVLAYVVLLNLQVSHSYAIKNMQQGLSVLLENQEKMDRELTELRSPENLTMHIPALGLVQVEKLTFPKTTQVVAKLNGIMVP